MVEFLNDKAMQLRRVARLEKEGKVDLSLIPNYPGGDPARSCHPGRTYARTKIKVNQTGLTYDGKIICKVKPLDPRNSTMDDVRFFGLINAIYYLPKEDEK